MADTNERPLNQPSSARIDENLRGVILEPLRSQLKDPASLARKFRVIIVLNELHRGRIQGAWQQFRRLPAVAALNEGASRFVEPYAFATLTGEQILQIAAQDRSQRPPQHDDGSHHAVHMISLDHEIERCLTNSIRTVKADAAQRAFNALGQGIVWAVLDSGVDESHPHFSENKNLKELDPLTHLDYTADDPAKGQPLVDVCGHGTHVAGIIAGGAAGPLKQIRETLQADGKTTQKTLLDLDGISGVAPQAKILSLKVLRDDGKGFTSSVIEALRYVQEANQYGRRILVHGVNMSLGYDFDPTWYACGQSPICVEVDRLVKSGVVVVVAAGNAGFGRDLDAQGRAVSRNFTCSITDPGNAELAITVGATHRDMPHTYGVSYFSSKGPTGDGRLKPDLVAPGERIVSCLSSGKVARLGPEFAGAQYIEDSGTSMAAPHVSGALAAFLSVRNEFVGRPEALKQILLDAAIDLKRDRYFQGSGLLDLVRALQSI